MGRNINLKRAISFVEVMLAFLILAMVFLPIFRFVNGAVKDTEMFYTETVAMSRAKFIMDTLMFQMPWRVIREGNPCRFEDPKKKTGVVNFIKIAVPKMLGLGCTTNKTGVYKGDGLYTDRKGFKYRARIKILDLDYDSSGSPITFTIEVPGKPRHDFEIKELVPKDADGKYNLIKKIIVQIKWSNTKGKDPNADPRAKKIFLVGYKSNLEG